jgi:hypothetical protein
MTSSNVIVAQRRWLSLPVAAAIAAALAALVGYFAYDAGLQRAGFNRSEASAQQAELVSGNRDLVTENKALSERIAVLETANTVDREAYRQVEAQLIELQDKILAQQEDIEFYRGIVDEDDGSLLRIQAFAVRAGLGPQDYELQLVLAQALRSKGDVSGSVRLALEGQRNGAAERLEMREFSGAAAGDGLRYSFRYFQDLKSPVTLPEGFQPERVHIRVNPQGKGAKTVEEFFAWQVDSG